MQTGLEHRIDTDSVVGQAGAGELAAPVSPTVPLRISLDSAVIAAAILTLAAAPVLFVFWPGIIHFDTAQIIADAHRNLALDWWTGLGTLVLHAWFAIGLGVPLIWLGIVAANILGVYGCLRPVLRRVPAACTTLAFVVFPPIYGQLAAVSRDSADVGFSLLAFAALARILRTGGERRRLLLTGALVSAVLAAVSRQNGIAVVFAVTTFAALYGRGASRRRVLASVIAASVAAAGTYVGLQSLGSALSVRSVSPQRATYVYDLAAISVATGHDQFPQRQLRALPGGYAPPNTSEAFLKRDFRAWNVTSLRSLREWARLDISNVQLATAEKKILQRAWIRTIEQNPLPYLKERAEVYAALLGIAGQPDTPPVGFYYNYAGIENTSNFGHPLAFPNNYVKASDVLDSYIGTNATVPIDRPWIYLVLITGALIYMRRRRSKEMLLALTLAVAIALDQVVFFFTVMAAGFRYEDLVVPGGLLCLAYALATRSRWRTVSRPA